MTIVCGDPDEIRIDDCDVFEGKGKERGGRMERIPDGCTLSNGIRLPSVGYGTYKTADG